MTESESIPFSNTESELFEKSSLRKRADCIKSKRCRYLLAVLENPKNVHNIGAVIRNIDALGISKLYVVGKDIRGKKNMKWLKESSVGACGHTYIRTFDTTKECIEHLRMRGYSSLVTSPHTGGGKTNIPLKEGEYQKYGKLAVWFGNESRGISQEAVDGSSGCINIDMCGIVESLNLSVSTGIVLYHIASERRLPQNQEYLRKKIKRSL